MSPPGGSSLAAEVAHIPPLVRSQLPLGHGGVMLWDMIYSVCEALTRTGDIRPWPDRLQEVLDTKSDSLTPERLNALTAELTRVAEQEGTAWISDLLRPDFLRFLERAVGTGMYHRLRRAALDDVAVVAAAIQSGVRTLQPYALAIEDMLRVLSQKDRDRLRTSLGPTETILVKLIVQLDHVLVRVIDAVINDEFTESLLADLAAPTAEEVEALIPKLRSVISDRASQLAEELGAVASRKIRGARDALTLSADPVSQAANSLIELIDRLLRTAFSDDEILDWAKENYTTDKTLMYDNGKGVRPTKRAQALCFIFGGQPKGENPELHEILAEVLVNTRAALQALKHSDTGLPEELNELGLLMGAIEGFFALGVRVAWGGLPPEAITRLYGRIDPGRLTQEPHATVHDEPLSA